MSGEHGSVGSGLLGRIQRRAVATIAAAAAVLASATTVVGSTASPPLRVIQPGAAAALTGQTYSQWTVGWWQTMMALPTTNNPATPEVADRGDTLGNILTKLDSAAALRSPVGPPNGTSSAISTWLGRTTTAGSCVGCLRW